uniref:Ig-like domain-containing protein n=1 Tax=Echeneis naucrates TaxID=173247 RepID=A0A665WDA3_ECHNA
CCALFWHRLKLDLRHDCSLWFGLDGFILCHCEPVGRVILTASSRDLVEFSSVRLSCSVSSGSSVSFLWLNSSSEVTASDRVQLTDGNANLTIVSVTRYDRGPYKCDAFNALSHGSSDPLLLSISFGPENTLLAKSPSQENYLEGSNIRLSCSAVSNPAALFYWLLNGSLLSDTGPEFRLINVQMSQSGNYSCQAFNNQTMIIQTSQPSFISVLIYAVTPSTKQPVEGNSVNLTCDAAGSIFIRKWKKNGADLALTDNMKLHDEGRVLCFQPLNKTDNGTYSCMISNPLSSVEAEYIMIVNYGPENVQITGPSQITLNETLTLTCSADSTPSATYIWKLNETETLSVSAVFKKNITDFSDSGRYICEATNNITRRTVTAAHYLTVTLSSQGTSMSIADISDIFPSKLRVTGFLRGFQVQLTDGNANLTIVNVTRYDRGPYKCDALNAPSHVNLLSFLCFNQLSVGPENTLLTKSPSQENYLEGSNIRLSCSAVSNPAALFYWLLNGSLLSDTGPEFRLINVQLSQSGNYSCQAFNNQTMIIQTSQPSFISVLKNITDYAVTSSTKQPVEGNSVNLTCDAAGSIFIRKWKKNGADLALTDNMKLHDEGRVLCFQPLNKTDNGTYSCMISNPLSSVEAEYIMIVNYGPENVQITGPSQITLNETLTLTCSADSTPSATYIWKLNETETLSVSALSQSGDYSCQAFNNQTMIIQTSQPSFISVLKNITDYAVTASTKQPIEGNSVNLTCDAAGSIFIRKWKKNGADLAFTDNMKLHDEGRVLCFQPLTKTDNGTYSCMISNPLSSVEAEYIMIVNYGPENVQITGPSQITLNETLTLTCSADSTPSATYIWKLNETETLSVSAEKHH